MAIEHRWWTTDQMILIKVKSFPSIPPSPTKSLSNSLPSARSHLVDNQRTHRQCASRLVRFAFGLLMLGTLNLTASRVHADPPDLDRYQVYELKYKDVSEAEPMVSEMLESFKGSVDIVTDVKFNRLLISGPDKAQKIAAKLLKSIDVPAKAEKNTPEDSVVKSYSCPKSKFNLVSSKLRERYADVAGVRITGDVASEQLLILAPPEIHSEIQGLLSGQGDDAEERPGPKKAKPRVTIPADDLREANRGRRKVNPVPSDQRAHAVLEDVDGDLDENGERVVELMHVGADHVEPFLRKLLGPHFEPVGNSKPEFRITDMQGMTLDLKIDKKRNVVRMAGNSALSQQVATILRGLDDPAGKGTETTRILPLRGIDPEKINEVQNAFKLEARRTSARGKAKARFDRGSAVSQADFAEESGKLGVIQLVGAQVAQVTPPVQGNVNLPNVDAIEALEEENSALRDQLRKLGTELDVEILPDLDVVILRGNKNEVQEMTRLLKELEKLSVETEPKIEIYPLKHVRGDSLTVLIDKVNSDLTAGLRGKVSITPLIKPNALLLIGWGETVTSIKALIEALDQPIPPEAQFQVFRLKHADVTAARTTVQEYFTQRAPVPSGTGTPIGPGLSPRVQVTADARTNSLIVQAQPRDMQEAGSLIEQLDVPGGAGLRQARVFKLKNSLATDLATVLQSAITSARGNDGGSNTQKSSLLEFLSTDKNGQQILKSGMLVDVRITAEPHTNTLLVSAPPDSMEMIAALIQRLDESSPEGAQIKVFRVLNGDAFSLVTMLRSLLPPSSGTGSVQLANSRDETSLVPTRFSVDQRTNSIIATGSPGDLRIVEALLFRLDQKDVEQRKNQVYRLKNGRADAVARSVNDFLRSERNVQRAAPGAMSAFQQIESEVVVVPEPVSNSLIISATPRFYDEIEALVRKLDAQVPQVMIQVLIAQVALNNTNEFGVELGLQDSLLFDRSLLGNLVTTQTSNSVSTPSGIVTNQNVNVLGATNTPGFNFNGQPLGNSGSPSSLATASNVAGQAVSNFGLGIANSTLGYGGMVLSASSENVSVLIRALQQSNRLEVLSRPQIRTLDNQAAFIQIGQRVPRLETVSVNTAGSVNGVRLENVGLILGVTPRISPDGMVLMEVDAEKSEVDQTDQGIPVSVSTGGTVIRSPIFNITTASTTVSANSGETIIIGGLITMNTNDTKRRVPFLSDIPVVGNFFRYDSLVAQRTELLIILTPYVIRSPEESARIKREEAARMHWCAGDVVEIYGPGIINDVTPPPSESTIPVIYPDLNPRGSIQSPAPGDPTEVYPVPPLPEATRGQMDDDSDKVVQTKPKKSSLSLFNPKKKSK